MQPISHSTDYDQDDNDSAEVEAALAEVDEEINTTEEALTEWGSRILDPHNFHPRTLSTISERTNEEAVSRRLSTFRENRPFTPVSAANPSSEILPLDTYNSRTFTPRSLTPSQSHSSDAGSGVESPGIVRHAYGRRAGDLIAFFEDKSTSDSSSSISSFGNIRSNSTAQSPAYTTSQSLPSLARLVSDVPPSYTSIPHSTTMSTLDTRSPSPTKAVDALSSLLSSPRGTTSRTVTPTSPYTGKQPIQQPRSPLSSVRNIVTAWRERTPPLGKSSKTPKATLGVGEEGFFSVRRRGAVDTNRSLPPLPVNTPSRPNSESNGNGNGRKSGASASSGRAPFDLAELGPYAQSDREPLRLGQLWYLNVHAPPPYRWIRTQAVLYPHVLILSWIAPGGGRGVITLDLLNCNEVRSIPSPNHPSARDDIGTVAAQDQAGATGIEGTLVEVLCPFQLLYPDGVERLGAESARERVRWVGAIWEALNRAVSFPDPSARSRSPAQSIRTIRSMDSSGSAGSSENKSKSGSASTVYIPPLDTIPDLPSSVSSISSKGSSAGSDHVRSHASADDVGFHRTRASDDAAISDTGIVYSPERRGSKVIAPSRSSSLRRTSSLADLGTEFMSAMPQSMGPRSRPSSMVEHKSDSGNSGYLTPPSRISARTTPTSSYYSMSPSLPQRSESRADTSRSHHIFRGSLTTASNFAPQIIASTLSLRGTRSASLLGDSHDGSSSDSGSVSASLHSGNGSPLSRSPGVRRRTPRKSSSRAISSSSNGTDYGTPMEGSDKENETSSGVYATASQNTSNAATPTERSYRSAVDVLPTTPTRTSYKFATSERSPSPVKSSTYDSIGYDVCISSDLSEFAPLSDQSETASVASDAGRVTRPDGSVGSGSDVFLSASEPTLYTTVRTQTPVSSSLSTISIAPSSTEYKSLSSRESTEYASADCRCPSPTEFQTAEICSEYETAAGSAGTLSSLYESAEICPPSKQPSSRPPSSRAPSSLRTIPSIPESISRVVPSTRLQTLSPSPSVLESEPKPVSPTESLMSPTLLTPTSTTMGSMSAMPRVSVPSQPTVPSSSTSSSSTSSSTPSKRSLLSPPTPSVRSFQGSLYEESSGTYESSVLLPSPSLHSVPLHEGVDTSFETSFLRPSDSIEPSEVILHVSPLSLMPPSPSLSTMSRTPSTVSSISMSSSRVGPDIESLYGDMPSSSINSSSLSSESSVTQESRLSTESSVPTVTLPSTTPSSPSPPSVSGTPASSRRTITPQPTFSVSISTPQSNAPSIASQLETVISSVHGMEDLRERLPGEILTHDVNRLLQYLHEIDGLRNDQSQTIARHLDKIESEILELTIVLKERIEKPPPVPTKDTSVGRSTITRTPTPLPLEIHDEPPKLIVPTVTSLTPPPERLSSPSSLETSISWLSSHHSDDVELMSAEEWPSILGNLGPPSSTSPSSITPTSPSSSSSPLTPSVGGSPAPSASTVRPEPALSLVDLRDVLHDALQQIADLRNSQREAHGMLQKILDETAAEDHSETSEQRRCKVMIKNIEDKLERILNRLASDMGSVDSSDLRDQERLENLLHRHRQPQTAEERPTVQMPIPQYATPTIIERFSDLDVPPVHAAPIQLDPLPTIQRPRTRRRPRSITPPIIVFRPATAPVPSSDGEYRGIPPFRPPESTISGEPTTPTRDRPMQYSDAPKRPRPTDSSRAPTDPLDMDRLLRDHRQARRPDAQGGFYTPMRSAPPMPEVPPRLPSAPPSLGESPIEGRTRPWYRPRDRGAPTVMGDAPSGRQQGQPPIPPPGTFVADVGHPPSTFAAVPEQYQEILNLLRRGQEAQNASIDQQREIMRYMGGLNDWLERDVQDRHSELRGIGDRIDQLRNELAYRLGIRPAGPIGKEPVFPPPQPGWEVPPPMPAVRGGPPPPIFYGPGVIPPPGPPIPGFFRPEAEMEGIPFIPPSPTAQPGLPPGFVAYGPPGAALPAGPGVPFPSAQPPNVRVVPPSPRVSPEDGFIPPQPSVASGQPPGVPPITVIQSGARPPPDPNAPPAIVIPPPADDGRVSPSRRPGGIVVVPPASRSRSRSRPPGEGPIIFRDRNGSPISRRSSRERPQTIMIRRSRSRSRSRSRTPRRTEVIIDRSRSRSPRRRSAAPAAPVVIRARSRSRSRSRSRTPPQQQIIISGRSRSRSPSRRLPSQPIVLEPGRRSRSRRRTPPPPQPIILPGRSPSRSRSPSPSRPPVIIRSGSPPRRSRTRSRAPIVIEGGRSRSRRRSRSRSPQMVVVPGRSRSRTRSPRGTVVVERPRSRSRGRRSPRTVFVDEGGGRRRSYSRGRSPVIIPGRPRSRSYSPRQPTQIVVPRSRSRSPTGPAQIVVPGPRSRSRSRRAETIFVGDNGRRRSRSRPRTMIIGDTGDRRRRSLSPTEIIVPGPRSRSPSRRPGTIIVGDDGRRRSRSRPRTMIVGDTGDRRRRSRSPTEIIVPRPRSRSSERRTMVLEPGGRRSPSRTRIIVPSRSRSRGRPGSVFIPRSRSPSLRETPIVIPRERSRSRPPSAMVMESDRGTRSRSRPPTQIILPSRRGSVSPPRSRIERPEFEERRATPRRTPTESREFEEGRRPRSRTASPPYSDRELSPPPPTVIQVPRGVSRESDRRGRVPTIVRARSRRRTPSPPVVVAPEERSAYDRSSRAPTVIPGDEFEGEVPDSVSPSPPRSVIYPPTTPPRRPLTPREAARTPSRRPSEEEREVGGSPRRPSRRPSEEEREIGGSPRRPSRRPSEEEREVGGSPRRPADRPVSAETVRDSQVILPTHDRRSPSEVVVPGQERYDEAFNDAEDERRLTYQAAEHARDETAAQGEQRRDDIFREHEEERQRMFEESEARRNQTAEEMRQDIFAAAEKSRSDVAAEGESERAASIHSAIEDAASRREDSIRSVIAEEREELRRASEAAEAERASLIATMESDRQRLQEEHDAKVRALEEELATLREAQETQQIESQRVETERIERQQTEILERNASLSDQLAEITNILNEKRAECEQLRAINEERWTAKEERRSRKDEDMSVLKDLVQRVVDEAEAAKASAAEEKERERDRPVIETVLEVLAKQQAEQSALLTSMLDGWRTETKEQHDRILDTVRSTANEQVPYNIQGYLDQFSRALADEVRMLLGEVGKLREEKRNLQFELGTLMCIRSKYGPGGEFDPDWKPNIPPFGGGGPPPPDGGPPPPEEPPVTKPGGWRNVPPPAPPRLSKRQKRQQKEAEEAAAAASAAPEPRIASWATWQPNPAHAPTPTSQQAELVMPEVSPGLFGPRTPPESFMKS